jgi:hypothetical protein
MKIVKTISMMLAAAVCLALIGVGGAHAEGRTMVDIDPINCWYFRHGLDPGRVDYFSSTMHRDMRYYHFKGIADIYCGPDIAVSDSAEFRIAAEWKPSAREATENVFIGSKNFTLTYSCSDDPWLAGATCSIPRIGGASPPVWCPARNKLDNMALCMRANAANGTFTSGRLPEPQRLRDSAEVAAFLPPQVLMVHWPTPIIGKAPTVAVSATIKAQVPDTMDTGANLGYEVQCVSARSHNYAIIPTGDWVSRGTNQYDHRPGGLRTGMCPAPVPADLDNPLIGIRVRLRVSGGPDSPWSEPSWSKFTRDQPAWPGSTPPLQHQDSPQGRKLKKAGQIEKADPAPEIQKK